MEMAFDEFGGWWNIPGNRYPDSPWTVLISFPVCVMGGFATTERFYPSVIFALRTILFDRGDIDL